MTDHLNSIEIKLNFLTINMCIVIMTTICQRKNFNK